MSESRSFITIVVFVCGLSTRRERHADRSNTVQSPSEIWYLGHCHSGTDPWWYSSACGCICRRVRGRGGRARGQTSRETWADPVPTISPHLELTLFPRRRFRRALSPRRVPSARPLRLAPWASGVAPGLIRTARARATIVQESAKCENTDFCNSWRPFLALERSSEKAFKNAKHGSQLLRSSS